MAGLFEGSAPPDVTTTTTKQQAAPQYLTDYLTKLAQVGQSQLGTAVPEVKDAEGNITTPASFAALKGEDLIASRPEYLTNLLSGNDPATGKPYTAGQLPGLSALSRYQTPLNEALTAGRSAMGVDATDISKFYDPYQQQVIDEMQKQSDINVQRNVLPALKALGVMGGAGGFGSSRTGAIGGQALADIAANLQAQQTAARSKGFQTALDAALKEQGQQASAASALSGLGAQEQTAATSGIKTLADVGASKLAYDQSQLEAPLKRALNVAEIMRGYTYPTSSTETAETLPTNFSPSVLQQIAGLGSLVGAAFPASGQGAGNKIIGALDKFFTGLGSEESGTSDWIDWWNKGGG